MDIKVENSLIKIKIETTSDSFGKADFSYRVFPVSDFEYYDFSMDYFKFKIKGVDELKGDLGDLTVAGETVSDSDFEDADTKLTAILFPVSEPL